MSQGIHSCCWFCELPNCVKAQRDELRERITEMQDNGLQQKQIDRLIKKEVSATVDTLDEIAAAIGCQPWQLLVPNMQIDQLPMLVMGQAERELYERIKQLIVDKK